MVCSCWNDGPSYTRCIHAFLKYKHILDTKGKGLSDGRLWKRIDDNKDGTYRVTKQVRGIEWISSVPAKVANYFGLVESEKYTDHGLQRTCAQWVTDDGMTDTQMQHHLMEECSYGG